MSVQALENNQVLLWGENVVKKSILDKYDKGNKNPHSLIRIKPKVEKAEKVIKKVVNKNNKIFNKNNKYTINDLDFLNKEYERIEKEIKKAGKDGDFNLQEELYETNDDLLEVIDLLENETNEQSDKIGKGFIKGSKEAIEHAEKMRKSIKKADKPIAKVESKARLEKGSEEAKTFAVKMMEAKKKKKEQKEAEMKEVEQKEVVKKTTGKPWYYIGDIPKGYREATEDEAIIHKKVSYYGKYGVDIGKLKLFNDYNIILSDKKSNTDIGYMINNLKKRIIEALQNIEIFSSKLDNEKYKDRFNEFQIKLEDEKDKRKHLQGGYDWYNKLLSERLNKVYKRDKIELPKVEISENYDKPDKIIRKTFIRPIDPRTGKEVKEEKLNDNGHIEEEKIDIDDIHPDLLFYRDGENMTISSKFFTRDLKMKSKYIKKAFAKGVILKRKYYTSEDYDKYFYGIKGD